MSYSCSIDRLVRGNTDDDISQYQAEVNAASQKKSVFASEKADKTSQLSDLKNSVSELMQDDAISNAKENVQTAQTSLTEANSQLSAAQNMPTTITETVNGETKTKPNPERAAAIATAQAAVNAAKSELEQAKSELERAQENQESEKSQLEAQIGEIENSIPDLDAEIEQADAEQQEAQANLDAAKAELEAEEEKDAVDEENVSEEEETPPFLESEDEGLYSSDSDEGEYYGDEEVYQFSYPEFEGKTDEEIVQMVQEKIDTSVFPETGTMGDAVIERDELNQIFVSMPVYDASDNPTGSMTFDAAGKLKNKTTFETQDDGSWAETSTNYDENNEILSEYVTSYSADDVMKSSDFISYQDGKMISKYSSIFDNEGNSISNQEYFYNDQEQVIEMLKYGKDHNIECSEHYIYDNEGTQYLSNQTLYDRDGNSITTSNNYDNFVLASSEEEIRDANDVLKSRSTYTYNNGQVTGKEQTNYDEDENVSGREIYTYENNLSIGKVIYDANDNITGYESYSYDDNNNVSEKVIYDANHEVSGSEQYSYDDENRISTKQVLDKNGDFVTTSEYCYDGCYEAETIRDSNGVILQINDKSYNYETGKLNSSSTYYYDSQERMIESVIQSANGELIEHKSYEFNDDNYTPTRITSYNANGDVLSVLEYAYDEQNRRTSIKKYNGNNELLSQEEYTYRNDETYQWSTHTERDGEGHTLLEETREFIDDMNFNQHSTVYNAVGEVLLEFDDITVDGIKSPNDQFIGDLDEEFGANKQGNIGDCWLLSSLNGLGRTEFGQEILHNAIMQDDDGYTVEFQGVGTSIHITNEELQQAKESGIYSRGDEDVLLMELATNAVIEQIRNGSIEISENMPPSNLLNGEKSDAMPVEGGHLDSALFLLTGKRTMSVGINDFSPEYEGVLASLENNNGNFVANLNFPPSAPGEILQVKDVNGEVIYYPGQESHAFNIKSVNGDTVTIVNPWDSTREYVVSIDELKKYTPEIEYYIND
ncbi:hypothetical protein IJ182_03935 [bacterium]|nr:hypothetical protein [bacterium]